MGGCGIGIRELTDSVKEKALELGFSRVGITTCDDFSDYERDVVSRGDDYAWYRQNPSLAFPGAHPRDLFPEGKSIIVTAYGFGRFAYPERLVKHIGRAYLSRSYSPLPESIHALRVSAFRGFLESLGMKVYGQHDRIPAREAGVRAGVVTYGNNNFAYTEEEGSFVILYTFIVDAELEYDRPSPGNICPEGCTLCRDVCPTHALVAPGRLKPGRCILKINIAGTPDLALADSVGERIHGCDACQEACPRNRVVMEKATLHDPFVDRMAEVFDLKRMLFLDDGYYDRVVRPLMYNYIRDLDVFRRNAAVAMGNSGDEGYLSALERASSEYTGTPVAEAANWAIAKLRSRVE